MVMRIKDLRISRGLTQGQLAVSMGTAQNTISSWETENMLPRTRDLPRLARVLGCEIGALFIEELEDQEGTS